MARLLLTLLLTCTLYMVVNLKITSLNIRRGFRNKIDDNLANYEDSDLICVQRLFSELILWKSLALYMDLSGLSTSCATEALFTGLLRGELMLIGLKFILYLLKLGFYCHFFTFIIFHWKHIYQIFRKRILLFILFRVLPSFSFSLSITSPSSLSSVSSIC